MQARLNPLTTARIDDGPDGRAFQLRSFAPGRSFVAARVSEAAQPEEFAIVARWLDTGEEAVPRDRLVVAQWLACGLLISPDAAARMPQGPGPGIERGAALADAMLPGIGAVGWTPEPPVPDVDRRLVADGHGMVPPLFGPDRREWLRRWYGLLFDQRWTREDEGPGSRRVIHNDPVGRAVLTGFTPWASALAGTALEPTYSFAAEYQPGNALPRHTDRSQCEYTVSLFIEHLPGGGERDCPWPIVLCTPGGELSVRQPLCGGPMFRGRELPHYRAPLGEGERSRHLFLHYVRSGFAGARD